MKAFNRISIIITIAVIALFAAANVMMLSTDNESGRPYRVEISRIAAEIEIDGRIPPLSGKNYVTSVTEYSDGFYDTDSDYVIREINGKLYRFDYTVNDSTHKSHYLLTVNLILGAMAILIAVVMLYIRIKILKPFEKLTEVPYELSKGNLISPVKETKNRFFGRFIWGVDMLRENMEQQKERELNLQKDKKMLLLSLSHDIKTPLAAIKLYSKALSKGLYPDKEKQHEIAESINAKADEIESYVTQIITASKEDFLSFEVHDGEFYLSELVTKTELYYTEKLSLVKTEFRVGEYGNCLIYGDYERSIEVIQNIMENAIKYGDGKNISINFSEEEGCILFAVSNTGCTLSENDLPHVFDSFWRGENAVKAKGSGLGLYICRQLMHRMNGDIFADIKGDIITVTAVFRKV